MDSTFGVSLSIMSGTEVRMVYPKPIPCMHKLNKVSNITIHILTITEASMCHVVCLRSCSYEMRSRSCKKRSHRNEMRSRSCEKRSRSYEIRPRSYEIRSHLVSTRYLLVFTRTYLVTMRLHLVTTRYHRLFNYCFHCIRSSNLFHIYFRK